MTELVKKITSNIAENNLIEPGNNILVAFSGGPDSTALLLLLNSLKNTLKFNLAACYINHNIRPAAVKNEIRFCWSICEKNQIDFHVINEDIPNLAKQTRQSLETAARDFRRCILLQLADIDGYDKIALAHHRDDILETILFRLIRGTGPGGLNPIVPISGKFIRPLFNIGKIEILNYLKSEKIVSVIDKSNLKSDFDRNYIRNKIIPVIEKRFGDKYQGSLSNFAEIVSKENIHLERIAERKFKKSSYITAGGKIILDLKEVSAYDVWLRRRIIKEGLKILSGHPGAGSFDDIENIDKIIMGYTKAVMVSGNIKAVTDKNCLILYRDAINGAVAEIKPNDKSLIPGLISGVSIKQIDINRVVKKAQKNGNKINIDFDSIAPPLYVRSIKPGDRFKPLGCSGTKKIGDYLTDKKISQYVRDEIFVMEDKTGIIWLIGYEIADRVKIDKKTKRVGQIEYIGKKGFGRAEIRSAVFAR